MIHQTLLTTQRLIAMTLNISLCLCLTSPLAASANSNAVTSPELDHEIKLLMDRFGDQNCTVTRDDKEYTARKARDNILEKYKLLKEKQAIKTTDEFIEHYASKSAVTGKPFNLKCGDKTSSTQYWLQNELKRIRKGK